MSNKNKSNRRQQYLQELWENFDISTEEILNQPPSHELQETEIRTSSSRSDNEKRKNNVNYTSATAAAAATTDNLINFNNQSDVDDQAKFDTLKEFDKTITDLPWNITTGRKEQQQQQQQTMNDPILSPKIDQLSIVTTTSDTTNNKESLIIKDIQADIEKIPNYLTKRNKSFQQMIHHVRSIITTATTTDNIEEIRKIAILIYKIMVLQTYHRLWTAYLKSGLGELINSSEESRSYPTTIPIWPKELKILLEETNENNEIYLNFVNKHLHGLDHQLKQYQIELNTEVNNFHGYTLRIQKIIERYIEQNLRSFRMKIEHQIELLHYDYHIRALKLEYLRHYPNQFQEQLMKEVCQSEYEKEISEQEYHCLRQQINYYNTSANESFEYSQLGQSTTTLLDSIQNTDIRQQLFQQYKEIAEQSRNELFQVYMKSTEEERKEYRKKYEENMEKMWSVHRHPKDKNQTISPIMIRLIHQRCQKISERIQCIYKFKIQSILP